jgi:hypothetical protein
LESPFTEAIHRKDPDLVVAAFFTILLTRFRLAGPAFLAHVMIPEHSRGCHKDLQGHQARYMAIKRQGKRQTKR